MILNEIFNKCQALRIYGKRIAADDFLELVIFSQEIQQWSQILSSVLGPPVKPAGMKPTQEHLKVTEESGGIWDNQTLFEKDFQDYKVIAKFWPWQDDVHTTLKMAKLA